jgi:hypothetical protein
VVHKGYVNFLASFSTLLLGTLNPIGAFGKEMSKRSIKEETFYLLLTVKY